MNKWPSIYYATKAECNNPWLRRCNPKQAKRKGVLGWRKWEDDMEVDNEPR